MALPDRPAHFPEIRYDRIRECLASGPVANRAARLAAISAFLGSLDANTTEDVWRAELLKLCQGRAAELAGDPVALSKDERLGWVRAFRKLVATLSGYRQALPGAGGPAVRDDSDIENMLKSFAREDLDPLEKNQNKASFLQACASVGKIPNVTEYFCWLLRRDNALQDLFADIKHLECLVSWLSLPVETDVGEWLALNVNPQSALQLPLRPTFLDGMSIEDDVWIPGGRTAVNMTPGDKCYDDRFLKGFEECIIHDKVPLSAVDHLTIKLFKVLA